MASTAYCNRNERSRVSQKCDNRKSQNRILSELEVDSANQIVENRYLCQENEQLVISSWGAEAKPLMRVSEGPKSVHVVASLLMGLMQLRENLWGKVRTLARP